MHFRKLSIIHSAHIWNLAKNKSIRVNRCTKLIACRTNCVVKFITVFTGALPLCNLQSLNEKGFFYNTTISFVFWMLKHLKNISYISFYSSVKYSKIKYTLTHIFNSHKNNVLSGVVMAIIEYQLFFLFTHNLNNKSIGSHM